MKGIAHFISGVAVASFCPWAISAAQEGNPAYFILGAVAGILPDTIDFKFYRYFYRHDIRVEPDQTELDPQPIADALAAAISLAYSPPIGGVSAPALQSLRNSVAEVRNLGDPQTLSRKCDPSITLKLSTIQQGVDNWRQYRVKIDPEAGEVRVQFGPVVSTGQVPQPGTLPDPRPVGVAKLPAPVVQKGDPAYTIDIFDGPSLAFKRNKNGQIEIDFLPWHRHWTHSLTVGLLLAGIASLWTWKAGAVVFIAHLFHIIEDQIGYMGSNLLFPFSKKRAPGLKIMHSGDAFPNFFAVWLCCLLIFWNLYAAIPNPLYPFTFVRFMMLALVIPFAIFGIVRWILIRADGGKDETLSTSWDV